MKKSEDLFLRMTLAALVVMPQALYLRQAVILGGIIFIALFLTTILFVDGRNLFPAGTLKLMFFFWLAVLAQAVFYAFHVQPLWIISLFVLCPRGFPGIFQHERERFVILTEGLGFWLLLIYLGVCHEVLARRLLIWSFATPAGVLLLLAAATVAWRFQPEKGPAS